MAGSVSPVSVEDTVVSDTVVSGTVVSDTTPEQLARLEGAMLEAYQRELGLRLNDRSRLEAVYGSHFFAADRLLKLNSICASAAQLLDAENAAVNIITADRQIAIATYGDRALKRASAHDAPPEVPLDSSFCQHVVGTERDLVIGDTLRHALVCQSLATTSGGIRSYLGVPIITQSGHILGSLCVWSTRPRNWRTTDASILASLSAVLMRFEESETA